MWFVSVVEFGVDEYRTCAISKRLVEFFLAINSFIVRSVNVTLLMNSLNFSSRLTLLLSHLLPPMCARNRPECSHRLYNLSDFAKGVPLAISSSSLACLLNSRSILGSLGLWFRRRRLCLIPTFSFFFFYFFYLFIFFFMYIVYRKK